MLTGVKIQFFSYKYKSILYFCGMIRLWIYILLGVLGLSSCINQPENTNIPNKRVSFLIDTSLSGSDNILHDCNYGMTKIYTKDKPAKLSMQGSYGVCGVIVVRTIDNYLCAFDLCCPYEAKSEYPLQQEGNGDFILHCPACGSEFEVGNGTGRINKGPATQPLKWYRVEQRGGERYYVHN